MENVIAASEEDFVASYEPLQETGCHRTESGRILLGLRRGTPLLRRD